MPHKKLSNDVPATYRIRIQGVLSESWSDRVAGLAIVTTGQSGEAPVTTLSGLLRDQAALCGVLNTLHNLRLPLLSVKYTDCEEAPLDEEVTVEP